MQRRPLRSIAPLQPSQYQPHLRTCKRSLVAILETATLTAEWNSTLLAGCRVLWQASRPLLTASSRSPPASRKTPPLERDQPRRPTRPRLPVRPSDAALWRRRPRPPSTVSHELLNNKHKSSSLADIARTAAFGQPQPRNCQTQVAALRDRRQCRPAHAARAKCRQRRSWLERDSTANAIVSGTTAGGGMRPPESAVTHWWMTSEAITPAPWLL